MDLFSITCTTCKSRLKVREESAIGQILGCPKCGGMVMVKAPEGWKKGEPLPAPKSEPPPGITTVVEVRRPDETLGDSNFDVVDDLLSDAPPKLRTPSAVSVAPDAPGLARPRFVGAPPLLPSSLAGEGPGVRGSAEASHPSQPAPVPETQSPPPPGEANAQELPPPDWSPPRPWRYWAMMAGSVVAGIALALAVVVGMIQLFKGEPQTIVQAGTSAQQPVTPTATSTNSAATPTSAGTPTPATDPPIGADEAPAPMPMVEPMPAIEAMAMPPAPMPAAEQDPIGLTEPPQPAVKPANPNDPLAKFDRLIGGDEVPAPETEPTTPAPPVPDPPPAVGEKPALPRPAPRSVNVTARLADPLPSIETSGTPLVDFLQFVSDLTTIPITLEPDALTLVRATPESPVVLDLDSTTVGAALDAAFKPLGLEHVIVEDQLVVRLIEPAALAVLKYPVKDLAADAQQMADLSAAMQSLIEPASWNVNGGEGTLIVDAANQVFVVSQRRAVHAQLLIAFERLRTARKLPYATGERYDKGLFKLDTRLARAKAKLDAPISLNYSQPTPLVQILSSLSQAAGMRILIDWRDVAAAGWNPDGEATLISDKQPLSSALEALLAPMDLSWRVVDGRTIQVLTPDTLAGRCELEFHGVADLLGEDPTGEAFLTKLRTALGESLFREAGGPGELHLDSAGQCLLASLPQPKQRELESLLAKLRSELGP